MSIGIGFPDGSFPPLKLTPADPRVAIPFETVATIRQRVHEHTNRSVPIDEIRLLQPQPSYYKPIERGDQEQLRYDYLPQLNVVWRTPIGACQAMIKQLAPTTKQAMITQLKELPIASVEASSIREIELKEELADVSNIKQAIAICNQTDQNQTITFEGEELQPVRLLSNHDVECRGRYMSQFRAASPEMIQSVTKYDADLAHCKKLLHDLPIALTNNQSALDTLMADGSDEDVSYEDIGPIIIEQYRIKREITAQQKKLKELQAHPIRFDSTKFVYYTHQTSVILRFGVNNLFDGKTYRIVELPIDPSPAESVTPTIRYSIPSSATAPS